MRDITMFWHDDQVGTISVPDSFRPPITQAQLDSIPATLFIRSRSWLYEVRPRDVLLQLRTISNREEVVAVADRRMGPGDLGCIIGFVPAADRPDLNADEDMISLSDQILKQQLKHMPRKVDI